MSDSSSDTSLDSGPDSSGTLFDSGPEQMRITTVTAVPVVLPDPPALAGQLIMQQPSSLNFLQATPQLVGNVAAVNNQTFGTQSPDGIGALLGKLWKQATSLFWKLWDHWWGNLILLGILAGIITWIIHAVRGSSSSAPSSITASMTPPEAAKARGQLESNLQTTSDIMSTLGYSADDIQTTRHMVLMTDGSAIAAAARRGSISGPNILQDSAAGRTFVTGPTPPSHYAGLNSMNMDAYLDSISQKPTNATIVANGAAVHGLKVETEK